MFLSKINSSIDESGNLLVKNKHEVIRFSPFKDGVNVHRKENCPWQTLHTDPGISLITSAHESRSDLPVLTYLNEVPIQILSSVKPFLFLQVIILQLVTRIPLVIDLLNTVPMLVWLIAGHINKGELTFAQVEQLIKLLTRQ